MNDRPLVLSSDENSRDASWEAAGCLLSAWDDSWGYGGRLTVTDAQKAAQGREGVAK